MPSPTSSIPSPSHAELDPALRAWLTREVGEVELVRSLVGGITAQMLQLRRLDGTGDVVVRRWPAEFAHADEHVRREADGLRALAALDDPRQVPAPRLLAADPDGSAAGRPTTVTSFESGTVQLAPRDLRSWVRELALTLARIHAVPVGRLDPGPVPVALWETDDNSWLEQADPGLAAAAEEVAAGATGVGERPFDSSRAVLSHGDYQHFNVLWQGERVSAVVDWPNVGLAERGIDVGHCRLNLAVLFSADAAMWFLEDYEQASGQSVGLEAQMLRLLNFGPAWPEFIPVQVAGRAPVDAPGMAQRVHETIARTLRRAG